MAASPCPHCGSPAGHVWVEGQCINVPEHDHRRADVGFLCRSCVDRINQKLGTILELYATLPFVTPTGSVPDDVAPQRHIKADAAPAPVRLSVVALLDPRNHATGHYTSDVPDVAGVLDSWAGALAEHLNLAGARLNGTLFRSVQFLRAFETQAAAAPWIDDYQAEIDWVWHALQNAHGLTPPAARSVGPCPNGGTDQPCGGKLWPDHNTAGQIIEQVTCDRCHKPFGKSYLGWLGRLIEDTA